MILKLKHTTTHQEVEDLLGFLKSHGIQAHFLPQQVIVCPKFNQPLPQNGFNCISEVLVIETPYQLAAKKYRNQTQVKVNQHTIGENTFTFMAGPCSVETEEQIFTTAKFLSEQGVKFLRGGAYKPRTSPYSFRGLELEGLKLLRKAADKYGMQVVTEILDYSLLDEVSAYADVLQVGSRNMHNFYLLNQLGRINKPILLKRGFDAKLVEWLLAAEYILSGGNEQVILCERGIRGFDPSSRNVLDLGIVPLVKELSHLPILIDPSHGTGAASRVIPASLAAAAIGADGLLVEVHPNPKAALSDSEQAITFGIFESLYQQTQNLLHSSSKKTVNTTSALNSESL